jgi:hypothetical protein
MWVQYFRQFDEENNEVRYYLVNDCNTLVIAIGQGEASGNYTITNFPFSMTSDFEPVEKSEFQVIFDIAVRFLKSKFNLR